MSSSPARTSGRVFKEVEIAGKKYALTQPQKVGQLAEMEAWIISRRRDPIEFAIQACKRTPATMHAKIWEGCSAAASRGQASPEEWAAFENSLWRSAFLLFKSMDPKHTQGMTLGEGVEWAMGLIEEDTAMDETMAKVGIVSQDAELKNSNGRPAEAEPAQTPSTADLSSGAGRPSIDSSPRPMDGTATR
jgi:hypothetical protein